MEQGKSIEELTDKEWRALLNIRHPGYEVALGKVLDVMYYPGVNTRLVVTVMERLQEVDQPDLAAYLVAVVLRTRRLLLAGYRDIAQVNEMMAKSMADWTAALGHKFTVTELLEEAEEQAAVFSQLTPDEFKTQARELLKNLPPGLNKIYNEQKEKERDEDAIRGAAWDEPDDDQEDWEKGGTDGE